MTPEDYYKGEVFELNSKIPKERRRYTYYDLLKFAEHYHNSELKLLNLALVNGSLLADFLKYAIDETTRISGDHDGNAGTLYIDDTYEKIAEDYISICNER